jgi:hypothetical protein
MRDEQVSGSADRAGERALRQRFLGFAVGAAALFASSAVFAQAWHVGDKVRVWVSGDYYDGSVLEVGSGDHAGQYLIDFDKFATDQYALAKNVYPRQAAPAARPSGKTGSNGCRIMVINGLPACDPGSVKRH